MFEWEIQIWPKVFAKKSNDAMYQDEDPGRGLLSLQNILPKLFVVISSDLNRRIWFFLILDISTGFPYVSDAVLTFCQSANKYLHFLQYWDHFDHKVHSIYEQFDNIAYCV